MLCPYTFKGILPNNIKQQEAFTASAAVKAKTMDKVKYREKREHERFESGEGCRATVDNSGRISIKNISHSGIRGVVTQPLYKDGIHTIDLFSGSGAKITLTARVIWSYFRSVSSMNSAVSFYEAGFRFIGMDNDTETALKKLISGLR